MRLILITVFSLMFALPVQCQTNDSDSIAQHVRLESKILSEFWGRPMHIEAGVVIPPDHNPQSKATPVCYSIHGFGGSHRSAWRIGTRLKSKMKSGDYPRMIYVFLNAQYPMGHHEFADSANNGPWGKALTEEFIPYLEKQVGAVGRPEGRLLTGHSSGGWSSLWLQVSYPEFFGGTWSTAPDAADFRDFTGINIYEFTNAYVDPSGDEVQLVRRNKKWVMTVKKYAQQEVAKKSYGGQFGSFDAVFSPKGEDGRPMELFDRESGAIDPVVAKSWEKYDIRLILKRNWKRLGPKLSGKIRVYVGTEDTFRLEGAARLLKQELEDLESDAEVVLVEGRDHGSLFAPHETLWPDGLLTFVHRDMWKKWMSRN